MKARGWTYGAVLAGVLLASGCGGGKSPSVASLATTPTTSGASTPSYAFAPPGGAPIGTSISITVGGSAGAEYASCMRSHGVPSFPDPDSQGTITVTVSASLDPSAPLFERAEADCQHLLPPEQQPSPATRQRMKAGALAFSACMRSHGVPNYPDPTFSNGGVSRRIDAKSGIDPSSPVFKRAQQTCQSQRDRQH